MNGATPTRPLLDRDEFARARPHWDVDVLDTAPSTNAIVADRARDGSPEHLVVVAEHQTAGRGRLDRSWETPDRAALTFSVLLRPTVEPDRWPWLPLITGLAVGNAVGENSLVKWPNDVLIGEKKVAGILVERVETRHGPAAVVGVGINVTTTDDELPVPTATSLALEGIDIPREILLLDFLNALDGRVDYWSRGGRVADERTRREYAESCATIGQEVRVDVPSGTPVEGTAVDIDAGGRLVVETATGRIAVGAGDVIHVRPAG